MTGSTGYIGKLLVSHLLATGVQVVGIGRTPPADIDKTENFVFIKFRGAESLVESFSPFEIVGVIHLATFYTNEHRTVDVQGMLETNVVFLTSVTEAAVQSGAKWLVNIGSHAQLYGADNTPASLYAASKSAFQQILRFYADAYRLQVATLLLGDVFGPHDQRPKILNIWREASETSSVVGMSPGNQIVQPIHVLDVVHAIEHTFSLLEESRLESPGTFLLRGERSLTLIELAKLFSKVTERRLNINWGDRPYHPRELMSLSTSIPGLPDWEPSISLEEGLRQVFR